MKFMTQQTENIRLDIFDDEVQRLISPEAKLELLADGFIFTEGPLWDNARGSLFFSDIPANTMYRYSPEKGVSVYRKPSNFSNGMTLDREGRLISCEHHTRRVTRERNGHIEVVADSYKGAKFNSPNDVIVAGDGSILFSDPAYGLLEGLGGPAEAELDFRGVFRVAPEGGDPEMLVNDFEAPNGLAFSPDQSKLYIVDSTPKHVRIYNISDDWKLTGGEIIIQMEKEGDEIPDGMKIDVKGNIFCTGPGGIWIYSDKADLLGHIQLPQVAANLNWGGMKRDSLYITASTGLYRIKTLTHG
jgi:gluconolactonase